MNAAELLVSRLATAVPSEDISAITQLQDESIHSLSATEAQLVSFNSYSTVRYEANAARVETHVAMLKEMKADLDSVFKRIRAVKAKLAVKYPEQYREAADKASASQPPVDEDDD
ncbi:KxDL motif-containing protein 1 [Podochytrium sp. JEL0797]|nr:KxDL motif-containing protein 1 [Podochytrium sp. JEL0797]